MVYSLNLHTPKCRQPRLVLAALCYVQVLYMWCMNSIHYIMLLEKPSMLQPCRRCLWRCGDVSGDILINIKIHALVIFEVTHEYTSCTFEKLLSHVHVRQKWQLFTLYMHDHAKLIHNIVIILNSSLNQNITQWVKHEQFSNVLVVPCELFTIQNIPRHVWMRTPP